MGYPNRENMTENEKRIFGVMEKLLLKAVSNITLCADDPALGCDQNCQSCWIHRLMDEVEYDIRRERAKTPWHSEKTTLSS